MALAAAEARAQPPRKNSKSCAALAASAPSNNTKDDNALITALERERDAALDARSPRPRRREPRPLRQLSQSIVRVKDGAKGALSQLQKDAKTQQADAVKKAVDDVKVEAKKKSPPSKRKLKAVQDFAKKKDEEHRGRGGGCGSSGGFKDDGPRRRDAPCATRDIAAT